jgi:DNA mismatch endonuclease (patch repair protein)
VAEELHPLTGRPRPTPGRSRNMAAIRSRNTKAELLLRQALRDRGLPGYRCNLSQLPGKPDAAYTRWRIAVFVDGAYWHGHPDHYTFGRLGEYWDDKIRRTQQRDYQQQQALEELGYTVIRFWDFEVLEDAARCANLVAAALATAGRQIGESRPAE